MVKRVELYEVLKPKVGEQAAMALVEMLPEVSNLATKDDIAQLETRLLRRTLAFFVPLWVAVLATLVTLIALVVQG